MPHPLRHQALRLVTQTLDALLLELGSSAAYVFFRDGTAFALRGLNALPLSPQPWPPRLVRARKSGVTVVREGPADLRAILLVGVTRNLILAVLTSKAVGFRQRSLLRTLSKELRQELEDLLRTSRGNSGRSSGNPWSGEEPSSGGSSWAAVPPPPFRIN